MSKYEIREGTDLKWGIYHSEYNVRIAEFYPNTDADRKQIKELIQKPEPLDLEQKARELFSWSADPRTIKECEDFIREIVKK